MDMDNDCNIDNLRKAWRDIRIETPAAPRSRYGHLSSGGRMALISRFGRMEIAAAGMAVAVPSLMFHRLDMPWWLSAASSVFFIVILLSLESIRRSLRRINPARLTVMEALEGVYQAEKRILRHRVGGWIMAIPLLACMMVVFYKTNMAMFAGGCAGIAVGLPMGYLCWRKLRRMLAQMKEELEEEISGE